MSMIMFLEIVPAGATVHNDESISLNHSSGWGAGMLVGDVGERGDSISLEKAWHGLHFLLTGEPWGGSGPRAFLLCGGSEQGDDLGYGPARLLDAGEVREVNHELASITADQLWSRFDANAMAAAEIYGAHWEDEPEEDLREEYGEYFELLQDFVAQVAEDGGSLRITMG